MPPVPTPLLPSTIYNCCKGRSFDLQCWPTLLVYWEESFASEVAFPLQTWSNYSMPTRWVADLAQIALITVLLPSSIDHNLQTDESDHCAKRILWTLFNKNSSWFVKLDNHVKHLIGRMLTNWAGSCCGIRYPINSIEEPYHLLTLPKRKHCWFLS